MSEMSDLSINKLFKVGVITLSDRASAGIYEDKSGKLIQEMLTDFLTEKAYKFSFQYFLIADEEALFKATLNQLVTSEFDFVFTTGSTGIGPRDIAPEVVKQVIDKEIPGIMECIRVKFGSQFPNAQLSRSMAGVAQKTLIFALPGSPKAVNEYLTEIQKVMIHAYQMLHAVDAH